MVDKINLLSSFGSAKSSQSDFACMTVSPTVSTFLLGLSLLVTLRSYLVLCYFRP